MPLTHLICPHCNENVELNVTSVTRSRECPYCGSVIMLQFSGQDSTVKRKPLLTPSTKAEGEEEAENSFEPQVLAIDPRNRMRHDPEVRARASRLKWGAVILGAILLLVVMGNYLHWWGAGQPHETASKKEEKVVYTPAVMPSQEEAPPVQTSPASIKSEQQKALKAVTAFLNATTVEERLDLVRDRSRMEDLLRAYYAQKGDKPIPFKSIEPLEPESARATNFEFEVVLKDGSKRIATAGKTVAGTYLVDWGSLVLHSEMEWSEFMQARPTEPVFFRVLASEGDYFENEFDDPHTFGCLKLSDPRLSDSPPIYAYYAKGTTLGREIGFQIRSAFGREIPLILTLRFPQGSKSGNQVWVDERIAEGWVTRGR